MLLFNPLVPEGLDAPSVVGDPAATTIQLQWQQPSQPNGVITGFSLHRRRASIFASSSHRDLGVAFYGTSYASLPPNSILSGFRTGISLRFRTSQPNGVLVYSISATLTDFTVIELRDGIPWYLFDAGSGPAAIRPLSNTTFNDELWHTLSVSREGNNGEILVDGTHMGQGSSIGTDSFVGAPNVLYIGGIAKGAPNTTTNDNLGNSNTIVNGQSFSGCLFGVTFTGESGSMSKADFSTQLNPNNGIGLARGGCPVDISPGVAFPGGGYLQLSTLQLAQGFSVRIMFRTTVPSGVLLFAYGDSNHILIELVNSTLRLHIKGSSTPEQVLVSSAGQLCDGQWHQVQVNTESDGVILTVESTTTSLGINNLNLDPTVGTFLGGTPTSMLTTFESLFEREPVHFSGCLRQLQVSGQVVDMFSDRQGSELVRYGSCASSTVLPSSVCSSQDELIDVGLSTTRIDTPSAPFTGEGAACTCVTCVIINFI